MRDRNRDLSGNDHYQVMFMAAVQRIFMDAQQRKHSIVCMKCLRLTKIGDIPGKCCIELGFPVDPKTVVVDPRTGKVTHAAPPVEAFENA